MKKIWITRAELRSMIREMVEGHEGMCEECGQMMESCACPTREARDPSLSPKKNQRKQRDQGGK